MCASILIIDDDKVMCDVLENLLSTEGYRVRIGHSGEEGLELCAQELPSLVLLDLYLPGIDGLETLRRIKKMDQTCRVVMITAYETVRSVVEAIKLGAEDYITKPLAMQELLGLVAKLVALPVLDELKQGKGLDEIVGESGPMRQVFEVVHRISRTSATVLITGESGTGKEVVARAIHRNSPRADRPFISLNCASIPANLLETELFGHEKGAFTDAKAQKRGLIEIASGSTLFLDEIGLMPHDLQSKILTVLETRRFRRLGGTEERFADVRFIAATNVNLEKAVAAGVFREDLYYRLNVIPIHLPPIRERGDDILLLARHFLNEYSRRHGKPLRTLSPEAETLLIAYQWSGNVRELKNVIERAILLTDGPMLETADLFIDRRTQGRRPTARPVEVSETGLIRIAFPPWGLPLEDLERQTIEEALKHTGGNISQAAKLLHISRYALRYRMQKHGIEFPQEQPKET